MNPGDRVTYEFYGRREEAVVVRHTSMIVWVDNGHRLRWIPEQFCTLLKEKS